MSLTEINDLMPFERTIYVDLWNACVEASEQNNGKE